MGASRTYHVVGVADNGNLYPAMTREEMAQKQHKAAAQGDGALSWAAQTQTGAKLAAAGPSRVVPCRVCNGNGCVVCRWAGVCRPGDWYKRLWQPWQLAEIAERARFARQPV